MDNQFNRFCKRSFFALDVTRGAGYVFVLFGCQLSAGALRTKDS
jgi:hypothetical protein